jgi:hypothetical protein
MCSRRQLVVHAAMYGWEQRCLHFVVQMAPSKGILTGAPIPGIIGGSTAVLCCVSS